MIRLVGIFISLCFTFLSFEAYAGAWGREKGETFNATTFRHYRGTNAWTQGNHLRDAPLFYQHKLSNWIEHGFTDKFSAGLQLNYFWTYPSGRSSTNGLGETEVWGHYKFIKRDYDVFSGQLLIAEPGSENKLDPTSGTEDPEIEPRLFYGRSWQNSWRGWSFLDASVAYRIRTGHAADQVRLDFTIGRKTEDEKILIMAQSFNKIAVNNDRNRPGTDFDVFSIALSGAYYFTPKVALQLGVQQDVYGRNILKSTEPFISLWITF